MKASDDKDVGACRRRPLSTSMLLEEMKSILCWTVTDDRPWWEPRSGLTKLFENACQVHWLTVFHGITLYHSYQFMMMFRKIYWTAFIMNRTKRWNDRSSGNLQRKESNYTSVGSIFSDSVTGKTISSLCRQPCVSASIDRGKRADWRQSWLAEERSPSHFVGNVDKWRFLIFDVNPSVLLFLTLLWEGRDM